MPSLVTLLLVLLSLTLGLQAQAPGYRLNWKREPTVPQPKYENPPNNGGARDHRGKDPGAHD
ncbi:hypothetical protein PGT21_009831 [Puccinia graminis f. sp. tritici]|uniref:Uncharacterized protein n=1 Tax=Puccinia graminis f. sp. tritici TaxID=56615 RepID=A0A5B0PHY9_PUCGR|nr:hypothetical protein PGT21_009831 [Puccinia graminis f. sp. tritici]KAA1103771.1 hypothetical protein PGTUg99_004562 [Puccinia graminis f. sp. tritici]